MAATRAIRAAAPEVAVLMLSMHSEETVVRQAMDAGARGYILKNVVDLDLAAAIVRVAAGESVFDQTLVKPTLTGERNRLTPREARSPAVDLRRAVEQGHRRAAEAERQHRCGSPRQYHEHPGRAQDRRTVVYALQHGLVNPL